MTFLKEQKAVGLLEILQDYIRYASRFGVYMAWRKGKNCMKLLLRAIIPSGNKFHVRLVDQHFEPLRLPPPDEALMDYFEAKDLRVSAELQKLIDEGAAKYVQIDDESFSSVLNDLEEFAYHPDAVTFILHNAELPYLLCLIGERVTQAKLRDAGRIVSAFQRENYERGKGGRHRDRMRYLRAIRMEETPGSLDEKASNLSKGSSATDHESARKYYYTVRKKS